MPGPFQFSPDAYSYLQLPQWGNTQGTFTGENGIPQDWYGDGAYAPAVNLARQVGWNGQEWQQANDEQGGVAQQGDDPYAWLKEQGYEMRAGPGSATDPNSSDTANYRLFQNGQATDYVDFRDQGDNDWFNTALGMAAGVTGANLFGAGAAGAGGAGGGGNSIGAFSAGSPEMGIGGWDPLSSLSAPSAGGGMAEGAGAAASGGAAGGGGGGYSAASNYGPGMSGAQTGAYDKVIGATGNGTLANAAGSMPDWALKGPVLSEEVEVPE